MVAAMAAAAMAAVATAAGATGAVVRVAEMGEEAAVKPVASMESAAAASADLAGAEYPATEESPATAAARMETEPRISGTPTIQKSTSRCLPQIWRARCLPPQDRCSQSVRAPAQA